MIKEVKPEKASLENYKKIVKPKEYEEVLDLAKKLKGASIIHLNATASGGGVAEILNSLIPLLSSVGLSPKWYFIKKVYKFFEITKEIHNLLQGKAGDLTKEQKDFYLAINEEIAKEMRDLKPDVWVMHDPQPAACLQFLPTIAKTKSIWRCHIDTSKTNAKVWRWFSPSLKKYDRYIYSVRRYIGEGLDYKKCVIIPPAIDPLNQKNSEMDPLFAKQVVARFKIDTERPLLSQISRFDPWKDPWGVIDSYRIAKKKFPNLQLALIGSFSVDDPQAYDVKEELKVYANGDKDIHILSNLDGIQALEVNAFQRVSDVIIQKSIREGFGLTVAEAMWKGKPVIGGRAGGILEQIEDGVNGFLVTTAAQAAERITQLLDDENFARRIGEKGKESVRSRFLITRLLRDHLKLYNDLLS
ncbi:MAG: glycosyltransferase [Candidatus Woykebacteria bacterium]